MWRLVYKLMSLQGTSYRVLFLLGIGLFSSFIIQAQGEGEIEKVEIEIVKNREVSVPQAARNFEKIPPRPVEPIKPEITYQFRNLSFNVPDYNPVIRPLRLKAESISKIYGNYVSAGLGNYSSPYAEAYFTNKRNKNKYYGLKAFHRSFMSGPVDDKTADPDIISGLNSHASREVDSLRGRSRTRGWC